MTSQPPVPITDLTADFQANESEFLEVIGRVAKSGRYIGGPEVEAFESEFASFVGAKYAIGVGSGTDAIYLALLAAGVGPGDEVITTPFTFVATAESIARTGATPVFADVSESNLNIDPAEVARKSTARTKAIVPVHLFGTPCDTEAIKNASPNAAIIEDCAQAIGASIGGTHVGSDTTAGCFSFFPSKTLGAFGDGGAVTTNDEEFAQLVSYHGRHGATKTYYYEYRGINSRLDSMQAGILRTKLARISGALDARIEHAARYDEALKDIPGIHPVERATGTVPNYYTFTVEGGSQVRDRLQQDLGENGISTAIYFPLSLHLQPAFSEYGYNLGDFPIAEWAQDRVLSLPMFPNLDTSVAARAASVISDSIRG
jgi:dTDP-4-amino-4,6-dideoxygalactose transaminase